jgi:hypothetical protein
MPKGFHHLSPVNRFGPSQTGPSALASPMANFPGLLFPKSAWQSPRREEGRQSRAEDPIAPGRRDPPWTRGNGEAGGSRPPGAMRSMWCCSHGFQPRMRSLFQVSVTIRCHPWFHLFGKPRLLTISGFENSAREVAAPSHFSLMCPPAPGGHMSS